LDWEGITEELFGWGGQGGFEIQVTTNTNEHTKNTTLFLLFSSRVVIAAVVLPMVASATFDMLRQMLARTTDEER
jgi:hypothetical protein